MLRHTVGVGRTSGVYRLAVHRLPQWSALHIGLVEPHTQGLDVGIRLAVGVNLARAVYHSGRSAHCALHGFGVGLFLPLHLECRVEGDGVEPEVGVHIGRRVVVKVDTVDVGKGLGVDPRESPVMGNVLVKHRHLPAPDTRADVAHAVVVAYHLVLVIRKSLTGLRGVEHDIVACRRVGAYQSPATRGGDHLVAVETQHAILAKRTTHLSAIP